MANLPLAFLELLVGAVVIDAGIKGDSIVNVVRGAGTFNPVGTGADSAPAAAPPGSGGNVSAVAPSASAQLKATTMLAAAKSVVGGPYSTAGHASAFSETAAQIKQAGTDCSGFVSYVLGKAGIITSPQTTVTLPDQPNILPGQGQLVTMWNRPLPGNSGHVIIDIMGQWFESGGQIGNGIVQMTDQQAHDELAGGGFDPLHPAGM